MCILQRREGRVSASSVRVRVECLSQERLPYQLCRGVDVDAEEFGGRAQLFGRFARSRRRHGVAVSCGLFVHGPGACFGRRRGGFARYPLQALCLGSLVRGWGWYLSA